MERRSFLGLAAGAGLSSIVAACSPKKAGMRIGILGGGILGASIAMHCAQAGADVTLLEKTEPAAGATSKSFAWINPFVDDAHYMELRLKSLDMWQALDKSLGMGVVWGGYVGFSNVESDKGRMAIQSRELAAAGHPTRTLDAVELKKISPEIDPGDLVEATYSDLGGHVDPVHATSCYLAAAKTAGAKVIFPCAVSAIKPTGGSSKAVTVATAQGDMEFDHVIVVTGVDAPALLAPLGFKLPLQYSPGALVHSKPMPAITKHVYDGPTPLEWKQMADGSIVGLEVSTPPHIPVHEEGILNHPMEFPPEIAEMHGTRILAKFAACAPRIADAEYDHMTLGFRPMPSDGLPVVGSVPGVPGVSVCVTHSGVTLAAALGSFMADEIISGKTEPLLAPYRPNRTFPPVKPV